MKTKPCLLLVCCGLMLLTSCRKKYSVEYIVKNWHQDQIHIIFTHPTNNQVDSNILASGGELAFFLDIGKGENTEEHLNGLGTLPFDELQIIGVDGIEAACKPADFSCWEKKWPNRNRGVGRMKYIFRGEE